MISADAMLPMLITICLEAELEAPMAMVSFIRATCSCTTRYSDHGYNLCMLEASIAHIADLNQQLEREGRDRFLKSLRFH